MEQPMIYLASRSPRRLELLGQLGVTCRLLLDEDEARAEALEAALPGEPPAAYVQRVTRAKAQAALARLAQSGLPPAPLLCADTTVAVGGTILGKPHDAADAGTRLLAATQVSRVRFCRLSPGQIDAYIASGEPFGKAGAYAIQGLAAGFVRTIEGSHSGIMGLPLYETARLLRKAGLSMRP